MVVVVAIREKFEFVKNTPRRLKQATMGGKQADRTPGAQANNKQATTKLDKRHAAAALVNSDPWLLIVRSVTFLNLSPISRRTERRPIGKDWRGNPCDGHLVEQAAPTTLPYRLR